MPKVVIRPDIGKTGCNHQKQVLLSSKQEIQSVPNHSGSVLNAVLAQIRGAARHPINYNTSMWAASRNCGMPAQQFQKSSFGILEILWISDKKIKKTKSELTRWIIDFYTAFERYGDLLQFKKIIYNSILKKLKIFEKCKIKIIQCSRVMELHDFLSKL